ncbi:LysM peptidoglycan-binding domain-containing protein [Salinarimonas rosea]|uniref:LysM peptidoglycan-binding domain-containing protein n=1 Tax=Salinarimonas rosea TaxID=552063 RepID=UPI0003F76847|nr:LysM peptidoglycan-binding domain-containing protein [Salinarimonas rosea]
MPVERRRTIAIIVTLLLAAGGIGAYVVNENRVNGNRVNESPVNERGGNGAATAVGETTPERAEIAAAVRPTVAPAPEVTVEAPVAEPPVADAAEPEPVLAEPVPAEPVPAEPVVSEPPASEPTESVESVETQPPAQEEVADSLERDPTRETIVAAVEPAAPAARVTPEPAPTAAEAVQDTERDSERDNERDTEADAAVFDLVRVEPTGDAVIAGRTRAGATVELLRNGERHDIIVADATGAFAFIPPPLPPGTHEIALQVQEADGTARRGRQSITVVVADTLDSEPVVALAEPGAPTRVLSQPEPPAPAAEAIAATEDAAPEEDVAADEAGPAVEVAGADAVAPLPPARAGVRIASVEAESGGGLYVSGEAGPAADVRLYLNETFVGGAAADGAGAVSFAIGTGVRPGLYRVRLDEVGGGDGRVLSRAEVTFEMPALPSAPAVAAAPEPEQPAAEPGPAEPVEPVVAADEPAEAAPRIVATEPARPVAPAREVAAVTTTAPAISAEGTGEARTATLTIPAVDTALVVRGDSLWRISRRIYGDGIRYTVIFDANQDQIRNPDLIFPGQIFVLPAQEPEPGSADARGG